MPGHADGTSSPSPPADRPWSSSEAIAAWHPAGDHPSRRRRWFRRANLLALGIVLVSVLTGVFTYATSRIGVAPRVSVTLVGTDYRDCDGMPPNGDGDRAIGAFARWSADAQLKARRDFKLSGSPIHYQVAADLQQVETDPNAPIAFWFLAIDGLGTANGPVLIPEQADGIDQATPLARLLERLSDCPEQQHKVVCIDAPRCVAHEAWGVVQNNFVRQVKALDAQIREIPNLVLLLPCDESQKSWLDPARGITLWASQLIGAMNGQADDRNNDGWIDLSELQATVQERTERAASRVGAARQTPTRLPMGAVGQARAADIVLFPADLPAAGASMLPEVARREKLAKWWDLHAAWSRAASSLQVRQPVLWKEFEDTLLRFERFEMTGCRNAADQLERELHRFRRLFEEPSVVESLACRAGLVPPATAGFVPGEATQEQVNRLTTALLEQPRQLAAKTWLDAIASDDDTSGAAYLRRQVISQQLERLIHDLRSEASVDRDRLNQLGASWDAIADPLQPLPQPAHLLRLLDRDLPARPLGSQDATRLARCLTLAQRADHISKHPWWDRRMQPWVAEVLQAADKERRLATDLMLGDQAARNRSEGYLARAEDRYQEADRIAGILAEAEQQRHRGAFRLRRWTDMVFRRLDLGEIDASLRDQVNQLVPLWQRLQELDRAVNAAVASDVNETQVQLRQLEQLVRQCGAELDAAGQVLDAWQQAQFASADAGVAVWLAALAIPGGTAEQRWDAWQAMVRFTNRPEAKQRATTAAVKPPVAEEFASAQRSASALRGQLMLAGWRAKTFDARSMRRGSGGMTLTNVAKRLELLESDSDWTATLQLINKELMRRQRWWQVGLRSDPAQDDAQPEVASSREDEIFSLADFYASAATPNRVWQQQWLRTVRHELAGLLAWQAGRFHADQYWSLTPSEEPYCSRLNTLLTSDATELASGPVDGAPVVAAPSVPIELLTPDRIAWTTQFDQAIGVRVRSRGSEVPGFAALWTTGGTGVELVQPLPMQRFARPVTVGTPAADPVDPAVADALILHAQRKQQRTSSSTAIRVEGRFRGRILKAEVPIEMAGQPDLHLVEPPAASKGEVAFRDADADLDGIGGGVVVLLDCSGSMGSVQGEAYGTQTKHAQAIVAIEKLLNKLPEGIQLSVWVFGQAVGETKTVQPAERSIRRLIEPTLWNPRDHRFRDQLIAQLQYPAIEPWNESPLVAAMIAASQDLDAVEGARSMVVITDGADNRVKDDPVTNPLGLNAAALLSKHFEGTGIAVDVLAFQVETKEQTQARRQLSVVESWTPPGRYREAAQAEELAEALQQTLRVRRSVELTAAAGSAMRRDEKTHRVAISPARGPATWTESLEPGRYQVQLPGAKQTHPIELNPGDRLVLDTTDGSALDYWSALKHEADRDTYAECRGWRAGWFPLVPTDHKHHRQQLRFEPLEARSLLQNRAPQQWWIDATGEAGPIALTLRRDRSVPGIAYQANYPQPAGGAIGIDLYVADRPAAPVGVLVKNQDFAHLKDLAPAQWQLSEGTVRLLSAAIETHRVPNAQGQETLQSCLVLRAAGPIDHLYRLRTVGIDPAGQDEQFFTRLGQVTLRQWPITESDVEQALQRVELISVDQFRLDCQREGGQLRLQRSLPAGESTRERSPSDPRREVTTRQESPSNRGPEGEPPATGPASPIANETLMSIASEPAAALQGASR